MNPYIVERYHKSIVYVRYPSKNDTFRVGGEMTEFGYTRCLCKTSCITCRLNSRDI